MTERQQKRNTAGQGQRRKTARPEQGAGMSRGTARTQERRAPRMRKMRRKRVKNTIILVLFLIVVFVGAFGAFYVLRGGSISTPAQAYDINREFQHQSLVGTSQRASAFASDLCVVDGDQAMDSVSLEDGQEGVLLDLKDKSVLSAIATHVGGTTENFVSMMNAYAAQLGCTGTHFTNPHGLQDENHYTTPYDIYLMLKEALNYPEFTEITQMPSYTVTFTHSDGSEESVALTATDHYLTGEANVPKGVTVLGGKTGTTNSAGNCLALLSQNSYGSPYISIVMGASSKELLYQQMTSLLEKINQ